MLYEEETARAAKFKFVAVFFPPFGNLELLANCVMSLNMPENN
jgi:hypothetical protein